MATTMPHAEPAKHNPWRPGTMPAAPSNERRGASRPPHRRMAWSQAANIALAIAILLAGLGVWKTFGGDLGSGGNDDPPTVPGLAMKPSTPETSEIPAIVPSPVATPEPITACDLSGDIPVIADLAEDESPVTTTSLYVVRYDRTGVNPRGDLKLGCEGEESAVLAFDVVTVSPGPWPGTVRASILPPTAEDLAETEHMYVNVANGRTMTFASTSAERGGTVTDADGSPWVVGRLAAEPTELAIVDLRTMEPRPLSELTGIPTSKNSTVMLSTPADDGTLALGFSQTKYGGRLKTNTDAPGDLLLLGASFVDTHWITLDDSLPLVTAITLSPGGGHAALVMSGEGDSHSYGIVSTTDGTEIVDSGSIPEVDSPFVAWVQNGGGIAYLAGTEIQTIAVDGTGEPETVFTAIDQLMQLQTTWDPNVVVARTQMDHGSDAPTNQSAEDIVYSINVETGEVHEFTGMDASASVSWITDAGALVMYQWDETNPEMVTYVVFDPVTGDRIGEIVDAPTVQVSPRTLPTIGPNSISISDDGAVEVIALGTQHIYAFTASSDGLTMQRVKSPDGMLAEMFLTANVFLSPDGSSLSLNGEEDEGRTRYMISLSDPETEWLGIPNTVVGERGRGLITFVEGMGD